ncbi:MAG: PorV/PorQ family protein [Elusimicrobia bacterium]|nr:PorV/PorQ family protein [Elusimicrobiota bacterium]
MKLTLRLCLIVLGIGTLGLSPFSGYADDLGTTGAQILKTPIGSRAMGMAGAFSAISDDASATHWNPAGLALMKRQQINTFYLKGLSDIQMGFLGYALPFSPWAGVQGSALGASVLFSQLGKIDVLRTNPDGSFKNSETLTAGSDMLLSLSYAAYFGDMNLSFPGLSEEHYLGVTARLLNSTLAQQYTAQALSGDIGYMTVWRNVGLQWAFVMQNVGQKIKFKQEADPLPLTYRSGLSWHKAIPSLAADPLTLSLEGFRDREKNVGLILGTECWFEQRFAFRGGYRVEAKTNTWAAGLGTKFPLSSEPTSSSLLFDYAFVPIGSLGFTHHISISLEFGSSLKDSSPKNYQPKTKTKKLNHTTPSPNKNPEYWIY